MSDAYTYSVRRSLLENERRWSLDDRCLSWSAPDDPKDRGHIECRGIRRIRLQWTGSRFDHARYQCRVTAASGLSETIVSTHFAGVARFEDRSDAYRPFVRALIRQVAAANPACQFVAGVSPLKYIFNAMFLLVSFALLFLVLLTIGIPLHWLIITKLTVIAFLLPLVLRWLKQNRPRRFSPESIPADTLPPGT